MSAKKQEQPVSFMSEHTVEYALVPKMIGILAPQFPRVIPIYFWATREGSRISRLCDVSGKVRVIAVFPRRPKVLSPGENSVFVKFNQQLFEAAYGAVQSGIPFLAGIPLISSLMDFGLHSNYAWFLINSMAIPQEDLVWELDLDGNVVDRNFNSNAIEGPLENHQILNIVHTKAMPLFWEEAIEKIKMVRSEYRGDTSFSSFFGIGYKPIYFVILET